MKPITFSEAREMIARFPPELQPDAALIAFSAYDFGISGGLVNQARNQNPYLALLAEQAEAKKPKPKPGGKAR